MIDMSYFTETLKRLELRERRLLNQIWGRDVWYYTQLRRFKEKHGKGTEGYYISPDKITRASVVYSFGVGHDISFDLSLIRKFGLQVYAFDPTPNVAEWIRKQNLPEQFHFFDYGIANCDGVMKLFPRKPKGACWTLSGEVTASNAVEVKVYRLKTILNMLGHQKIDILKMDIEGAEYAVIDDLVASGITTEQILVEFHHRFKNIGKRKTARAIKLLNGKDFRIFDISLHGEEYSFIRA